MINRSDHVDLYPPIIHLYLSELDGYPGLGVGVIGSDMVDWSFAYVSLIVTVHCIFEEHYKMYSYIRTCHSRSMICCLLYITILIIISEPDGRHYFVNILYHLSYRK